MDALEFLKGYNDICGSHDDCRECLMSNSIFCNRAFGDISEEGLEEAVRIIKTWLDEREIPFDIQCKTCGSKFVKMYSVSDDMVQLHCTTCGNYRSILLNHWEGSSV